ncbi:MAG: hypothetical protein IJ151_02735 [Bacteroidales bacterium]|nr:hypothetical protein [Bacteroidales bacterium]
MKKTIKLLAVAVAGFAIAACSSAEKMVQQAENVKISCDPEVLEVVAGSIDADVTVTYPADYFHPKAILEVTPVLVYKGREAAMKPFMYQGEKVKDNYRVVSSDGQTVREKVHFDYAEGMEAATLELRGVVKYKTKTWTLPVRKVAVGCNTTYMLVKQDGYLSFKKDNYQEVIKQTAEGQILYNINSADVASSQLKSQSVKDFVAALDEIKANERKTLTGTEVVAYASPDGGEKLNTKLSDNRGKSADKAWDKLTKGKGVADPEVKSIGQDWEGFKELVEASNIQDKDLILRVLSMYSDPAVRESEIKNISEVYTSLKSSVLPELRRARFIANVEYKNYTPEELVALVDENIDVLDEEALLRAATLVRTADKKAELYNKAVEKFGSDRAQFNLGVLALSQDKLVSAEKAFAKVQTKDADLENALGVVAMRKGDLDKAIAQFRKAGNDDAKHNMGIADILNGDYAKAAQELADAKGCPFNKTLAYILNDELDKASKTATCKSNDMAYLKAIIAARQGNQAAYNENFVKLSKISKLAERAANDIEFSMFK